MIMSFTYFIILKVAFSQIQAIAATQITPNNNYEMCSSPNLNSTPALAAKVEKKNKRRKEKATRRKEWHATKSVAIVYFTFLICWLPLGVVVAITYIDETILHSLQEDPNEYFLFFTCVQLLPIISTVINPFIYSSNKQFKRAYVGIYRSILGKKRTNILNSPTMNSYINEGF